MGQGKWGNVGQRVKTLGYKKNKFRESNVEHSDYSYGYSIEYLNVA